MRRAPTLTDHGEDGSGVTIRPHRPEDAQGVLEQSLDPVSVLWTTVPSPYSMADARRFVEETMPGGWADDSEWGFAVEHDGQYAGTISLRDRGDRRAEVAYGSHPRVRGTGVMERALRQVLDWGFEELDLDTVVWWARHGNWASRKLAWRVGFSFDGTVRRWHPDRSGELVDAWVGTLLRDEPRAPRGSWLDCPVLTGPGLTLRPLEETDVPRIREAGQDPVTVEWLEFIFPQPYTDESARGVITKALEMRARGTGVAWAFTDGGPALAGWVALFNLQGHTAELGYWAHPGARGTGLTRRAAALAEEYAARELGVRLLRAHIAPDNVASRRLAEANGFEQTGLLADATTVRGEPADLALYAKRI